MKTIGIVGAGTMGSGIAYVAALAGCKVIVQDLSNEILQRALRQIDADATRSVGKNKLSPEKASELQKNVTITTSFEELAVSDIVIEAAVESLDVKKNIFARLDTLCTSETILATNTSSLSVTAIAAATKHPDRVVGLHFFNPPPVMKLVEIVHAHQTSNTMLNRAREIVLEFGKTPVIVNDTPGFIVNRVARPFYGEALRLLSEGVASVEEIDRIVKLEGGFKMGPFALMDLIGIDVNFSVTKSIYEQTFGEPRYRPHTIQQAMVNAGLLGRKTKRGFYDYTE